jgi:superfamily II DNA or RNA helicase
MARFHQLESKTQLLLEYLSFVGRPLSKNEISEQFRDYLASIDVTSGRCDSLVSELANNGFLERRGGKFYLAGDILEEVSTHSAKAGRAHQQCETASALKYPRPSESNFVKARRALYQGQTERLKTILAREEDSIYYKPSESEPSISDSFLEGICSKEPLEFFPYEVAAEAVEKGLILSINQAKPADFLFDWLDAHRDEKTCPSSYALWLHQLLLRGIEQPAANGDFVVQSCREILSGDLSGVETLQSHLLSDEISKTFDYSSQEFIYVAGCYAQNAFALVEERLRHGDRNIHPLLVWFWDVRTGRKTEPCRILMRQLDQTGYPPIMQFYQFLLLYWAGFESHLEPGRIFSLATRYEQAGYKVMAGELEALYRHLTGTDHTLTPFLELLKPTKLWEATLTQLENWKAFTEASQEEAPEERVAWFLNLNSPRFTVTAKVQKRAKSGKWTKGRNTQVNELPYQGTQVLDDLDRKVLSAIALRERSQFNRQSQSAVLASLVDHPRLFDPDGRPLQLALGTPKIYVTERDGDFYMQVLPRTDELENFGILKLSDNRYELVIFDRRADGLANILPRDGVVIPGSEGARIQEILATVSREGLSVESCLSLGGSVQSSPADDKLKARLYPQGSGLRAEVGVEPFGPNGPFFWPGEGERYLAMRLDGKSLEVSRDLEQELENFQKLSLQVHGFRDPEAFFSTPSDCLEMLEELRRVPPDQVSVQWPQGKKFSLNRVIHWSDLRISVAKERDWFAVKAELQFSDGEQLVLAELLAKNRQQQSRFIELDDGSYVALTRTLESRLRAIEQSASKEKDGTFLLNPLTSNILLAGADIDSSDEEWGKSQHRIAQARMLKPELPSEFVGELRPYQRQGFDWLVRAAAWGVGVCLADDMGLGKTIQILALMIKRGEGGPALVVAPTSVCSNWKEEAAKFAPNLRVTLFGESDRENVADELGANGVLICSYGLLCRHIKNLKQIPWHTLILDESQAIKNTQTQRFKAVTALEADFRVAATGTPVENHLGELWALFRFLNPGLLGTQRTFLSRYSKDEHALENLKQLVSPFLLRRLKKDVLKELPPKTDITITVELSRKEKLFYESLRLRAVEKIEEDRAGLIGILAELMRLRRACCHPSLVGGDASLGASKLERFIELVTDLREGGHRALIFSQFVDHLRIIRGVLDKQGISYQYLDGSTPTNKRTAAVNAFQDGEGDLFLISLKAGGTGLNLTAANYVVHLDPWWNPATEDQASDRAHRIGQTQSVTVYRLISKDTIEEKILALHNEKRELVDTLLAGTDRAGKLSSDELLALLRESVLQTV